MFGALWGASVATMLVMHEARGVAGPTTCWFRRATGYPCATCGGTRTLALLLEARFGEAFALNPLVAALIALTPIALVAWWLLSRRAQRVGGTAAHARWTTRAAWVLIVLLGANWVYVLAREQ